MYLLSLVKKYFTGKVKSIGVSNFSIKTLTTLLQHARVVPAVNQVEAHPYLPQHQLLAFCHSHVPKIQLTAYSPVGKHKYATSDKDIVDIISNKGPGVTEAQILLSWGVQRGVAVVPKSVDPVRLGQNLSVSLLRSRLKFFFLLTSGLTADRVDA
jgi:glycerol 2-dehydrogenase (NADP+)